LAGFTIFALYNARKVTLKLFLSGKMGAKNEKWSLKFKNLLTLYKKLRKIWAKISFFYVKKSKKSFFRKYKAVFLLFEL